MDIPLISVTEHHEYGVGEGLEIGTKLLESLADVFTYRLCDDRCLILQNTVERLFRWRIPNTPEDVCLFRPDGSLWFATISHEKDGWFTLSLEEKNKLVTDLPFLALKEDE